MVKQLVSNPLPSYTVSRQLPLRSTPWIYVINEEIKTLGQLVINYAMILPHSLHPPKNSNNLRTVRYRDGYYSIRVLTVTKGYGTVGPPNIGEKVRWPSGQIFAKKKHMPDFIRTKF